MKAPCRVALIAVLALGCRTLTAMEEDRRLELAGNAIASWAAPSRICAARLIEEYGAPDTIQSFQLVWKNRGPWQKTVVWNAASDPGRGGATEDVEQTLAYPVPAGRGAALAAFSDRVRISQGGRALSVRGDGEPANFLTANVAVAVLRGMDPETARAFHDKTLDLAVSGKSSRFMRGLLFKPPGAGEPGRSRAP